MRRLLVVLSCLLAAAPALVSGGAAHAGRPGTWTSVSGPPRDLGIISHPGAVRTPDGVLHLVYTRRDATSSYSIRHVAIGDDGRVIRSTPVITGWAAITNDPEIVLTGTGLRVVFSGLRNTTTGDPFSNGAMYHALADRSGALWTLQSTYLTDSRVAYASYGTGVSAMQDGSAAVAYPLNSTIRYANTVVADPDTPADDPQFTVDGSAYNVEIARVPWTDEVWMSWVDDFGSDASTGVLVRRMLPTLGPIVRAPRSVTDYEGSPEMDTMSGPPPLVARRDGAVFVAYPVGYPTAHSLAVWRVGTARPVLLPQSSGPRYADLDVDGAGRVWAAWSAGNTVRAARSNPGGGRFGGVVTLGSTRVAGSPATWDVLLDADGTRADVVVNNSRQLMHQEVLAALSVRATPAAWDGDRRRQVEVRVTDAGAAVGNALVAGGGERCRTSPAGRCTLTFGPRRAGRIAVRASRAGYADGATRLRVRG